MKERISAVAELIIKLVILLFLLVYFRAYGQNSVSISTVGNFNPTTRVHIDPTFQQQMLSSDKSALGGSIEYDHWLSPHIAVGGAYEQNPSDGKLVFQPVPPIGESIWPQMRYEALGLLTEEAPIGRYLLYIQEGAGANFTNGYSNSGWSHDTAFAEGAGIEKPISSRLSYVIGAQWLETETGCYDGWRCKQTWGVVTDTHAGIKFRW